MRVCVLVDPPPPTAILRNLVLVPGVAVGLRLVAQLAQAWVTLKNETLSARIQNPKNKIALNLALGGVALDLTRLD
jgi:hypothetical protein